MTSRLWLAVACSVVATGAGLAAADRVIRNRYGKPPRHSANEVDEPPREVVDVQMRAVDGSTLRGWLRVSSSAQPGAAALVVHGWGGSANAMQPVSEALAALGLHVLLLDARGHGRSDNGSISSMPAFADDIRVALDWMRTAPQVNPSKIVLVGHSVGAGACLFVASGDPEVAAVVSLASMADPRALMARLLKGWMPAPMTGWALRYVEHAIGHRFSEFAPIYTIGRMKAPVLLLHGARDTTVPVSDAYLLAAQAPDNSTLVVLPEGDHFSIEALDWAKPDLVRFLEGAGVITTP